MSNEKPTFVYVAYIAATPAAVWQALTEGDFTRRYWGGLRIQSTWQVGAPVRHVADSGAVGWEGVVLQADPPRRLSYTFHMLISEEKRLEEPSQVSFELEPMGDVVKLTLTHQHAQAGATFQDTRHGWPAIMSSLKSLLETGQALPFTRLGFAPEARGSVDRL